MLYQNPARNLRDGGFGNPHWPCAEFLAPVDGFFRASDTLGFDHKRGIVQPIDAGPATWTTTRSALTACNVVGAVCACAASPVKYSQWANTSSC